MLLLILAYKSYGEWVHQKEMAIIVEKQPTKQTFPYKAHPEGRNGPQNSETKKKR